MRLHPGVTASTLLRSRAQPRAAEGVPRPRQTGLVRVDADGKMHVDQRLPKAAIHCSAMSIRRTKRTPSCDSAYSMKSRTAAARVAWPLHRG